MFSLIITIISIALVVALIAATAYYGGDALTQGRNSADAAAHVTSAQQISAATLMHISNGDGMPADVAALVTKGLLSSVPNVKSRTASNEWTLGTGTPRLLTINLGAVPADNAKLCEQINKNAGNTAAVGTDGGIAAVGDLPYACVSGATIGTDPQIFQYKF